MLRTTTENALSSLQECISSEKLNQYHFMRAHTMCQVLDEFSKKVFDAGIRSLSEEELLAQIDRSLAQADRGEVRDAEDFEAEFDAELKAAYGI